ncbi:MAG: hypothetical protein HY720_23075 [Planctomycetes bacterium]|nr:hypothetical protein [Planctomycetota bacterium]
MLLASGAFAQEAAPYRHPYGFELAVPANWTRSCSGDLVLFRAPWEEGDAPTLALLVQPPGGEGSLEEAVERTETDLRASEEIAFLASDRLDVGGRPALALRYRIRSRERSLWQVAISLADGSTLFLSFGAADAEIAERTPLFERILRSLATFETPSASEGHFLFRHPLGLAFEIPGGWTVEREGNRFLFAPPDHAGDRIPLVLAVTAPAPEELDSLDEIERTIRERLDEARLRPARVEDLHLGNVLARSVEWVDPDTKDLVRQTGLMWCGALVALTATAPREEWEEIDLALDHAEETFRFE